MEFSLPQRVRELTFQVATRFVSGHLFVTYCVGDYTLWFEASDGKSEGAGVREDDEE
jgi:hypothetical protein